ncbi:MAG: metallophosphoesterase [Gammaproteobacteria bacterium]|nr:metallophosphoesterase [Gammaproteobacteria bacterium]MDH3466368.1 metallophosphoesterase [Gammaproteobacteria bacterium]
MSGEIFAIGDVHGSAKELGRLLSQLPLQRDSTIVFLGDYVDRGPDSRAVIDTILELRERYDVVTLLGNHEQMLLDFLDAPQSSGAGTFIYNGGSSTLAAYSSDRGDYSIPPNHMDFLRELDLYYQTDENFFVHAGVPDTPLHELDPVDDRRTMLWIRDRFLKSTYSWSKTIVHGHSWIHDVEIKSNRINLDTGCAYGGRLTAMQMSNRRMFSVPHDAQSKRIYLQDRSSQRAAVRFDGAIPVVVERGTEKMEFETVNYSEIGMLIRDTSRLDYLALDKGEVIAIKVGAGGPSEVEIVGRVLRRKLNDDGGYYALQVISDGRPQVSG